MIELAKLEEIEENLNELDKLSTQQVVDEGEVNEL